MVAQQLYEGIELGEEGSVGLITYMRTDSFRVAPEAQQWARELVKAQFGEEFVPDKPPYYRSKETAQEAHEAIRPTYPEKVPEKVKPFLHKDQYHLYRLIWQRFIASQMVPAQLEQTTFIIGLRSEAGEQNGTELRASGTVMRFPGFMALYSEGKDDLEEEEGGMLPSLAEGCPLRQAETTAVQHFTQPPPRYSEATLIKALEEKGIGRPSTYATILSTIQDRKYVQRDEGKFKPTELGMVVNDLLVDKFPELIDVGFTAKMETELDEIENAKLPWVSVMRDFYTPFTRDLGIALKDMGKVKPEDVPTEMVCEKCGMPMVIRWGRHGRFLACSGFPKCKNAKPINGDKPEQAVEATPTEERCEKCDAPMVIRNGRFGKFLACSNYPQCKHTRSLATGVKCPLDGGDIVERRSRRGKPFWSCSNYPGCTFALWYRPVPKECPRCHTSLLVEKRNKAGELFHACVTKGCSHKEKVEEGETTTAGSPQAT
jgi:DNA topoisomerase-1